MSFISIQLASYICPAFRPTEIITISSVWTLSLQLISSWWKILKTSKNYFLDFENCVYLRQFDFWRIRVRGGGMTPYEGSTGWVNSADQRSRRFYWRRQVQRAFNNNDDTITEDRHQLCRDHSRSLVHARSWSFATATRTACLSPCFVSFCCSPL